jgi:oligopeptide/dipeptide ABC transporter ATP-binding protein
MNLNPEPMISVSNLVRTFKSRRGELRAVDDVSLTINKGEAVGLVGESGSGKSTLVRLLMNLTKPSSGEISFDGVSCKTAPHEFDKQLRTRASMVFQDCFSSINPMRSIGSTVEEPLKIQKVGSKADRKLKVAELLESVGLSSAMAVKRPANLSGGQRQRVAIARALALDPDFLVLDEPVSSLDVSVQAQVLNLLRRIYQEQNLTYLFVSHDLGVVRHIADRVLVMYLGRIVEAGPVEEVFENPQHPYTISLLSNVLNLNGEEGISIQLTGDPPSPVEIPSGCRFSDRCFRADPQCKQVDPRLVITHQGKGEEHTAACLFPGQLGTYPHEIINTKKR